MKDYTVTAETYGIEKSVATNSFAEAYDFFAAWVKEDMWDFVHVVDNHMGEVLKSKPIPADKQYLFEDLESGEEFIVGANNLDKAVEIALENFLLPAYRCQLTEIEAEASGLDEY